MKIDENSTLIQDLITAAIDSVRPEVFIPDCTHLEREKLYIQGKPYCLNNYTHIYVVSVGKAAYGMAKELDRIIQPYITEGIILTKHLPEKPEIGDNYQLLCGGHPVPTEDSVTGAKAILSLLDKTDKNDLVIFLISGGGSALMTAPIDGIDLETFQSFSKAVLGCGADIKEFNTLRKHLDGVKGGRLALRAAPAKQVSIILSDVVGNPLEVIASGPTVPDPGTYQDALEILNRYGNQTQFPKKIRETLKRGADGFLPETLKDSSLAGDVFLPASNRKAAYAAAAKGKSLGLDAQVLNTHLTGEASMIGELLPSFFSEMKENNLLVFGGETTVHIRGNGSGGRNQELALSAVRPMAEWPGCVLVTLATDGEDGPTDAAGAVVTSETLSKALNLGIDPDVYLKNNDSFHFFEKTGGLLRPGSTGTNVNDLTFLLRISQDTD